jgi:hypothetical protein
MRWAAEVSSSVYSTPLIADVFSDGTKEVIVPTFVHYLELLEARACAATPPRGPRQCHSPRVDCAARCSADAPSRRYAQGGDGTKTEGFPAYHASMVHTSPFLFDFDGDGVQEVGCVRLSAPPAAGACG